MKDSLFASNARTYAILTMLGFFTKPACKKMWRAAAGPRMAGQYSGQGGLRLEFHPTAAVLDCGEAHVLKPYAVENTADRIIVTIRNGSAPLTLTLQPDGTLTGSGAVDVAGPRSHGHGRQWRYLCTSQRPLCHR